MSQLLKESWTIWKAGGFLMVPLAIIAFAVLYAEIRLYLQIRFYQPESSVSVTGPRSISTVFETLRESILQPIDRKVRYYSVLVGVCPLLGLLGTVVGMTTTFTGMAQPGTTNLSQEVANGISEALVTTQAGLLVAIPGLILISLLKRSRDRIALRFFALEAEQLQSTENGCPNQLKLHTM
ncbi:MAG: MotA/TolQ/ExbB proton channel family protein [Verrucomicrobiota bacterium]